MEGRGSSNSWDVANAANSIWLDGAAHDIFYNLDTVTFTNTSTTPRQSTYLVHIVTALLDYRQRGEGLYFHRIEQDHRGTGLTKSGTGTLILETTSRQ